MMEISQKKRETIEERDRSKNEMAMEFDAISSNESFARVAVAAFITPLNPTMEEISDIKTAVSEAVTNAIIHGYENVYGYENNHGYESNHVYSRQEDMTPVHLKIREGKVYLRCRIERGVLYIEVEDKGVGIEDLERAMEPLYTSKPELERSGMGFAFMEAFMDDLEVESKPLCGTIVRMQKKLCSGEWIHREE